MPSLSNIAIVLALAMSAASLIVLMLSSQKAKKRDLELEQLEARLERRLTAKIEEVKRDISFFKLERNSTTNATLKYIKEKRAESGGSLPSSQYNVEMHQTKSKVEESPETGYDPGAVGAQGGDNEQGESSVSENSSRQKGNYDDDSPELESETLVPYSLDLVQRLYRDWCTALSKPEIPASLDVRLAEYAFLEPAPPQGGAATHVIRDTSRIGEFIRFSAVGADVGVVLPNPTAHFTPVVAHLFPGLARDAYEGSVSGLTALGPVSVKRRTDSEWEAI